MWPIITHNKGSQTITENNKIAPASKNLTHIYKEKNSQTRTSQNMTENPISIIQCIWTHPCPQCPALNSALSKGINTSHAAKHKLHRISTASTPIKRTKLLFNLVCQYSNIITRARENYARAKMKILLAISLEPCERCSRIKPKQ